MKKKNKASKNTTVFKPESLMMSYGYKPELSVGAIKCPIYQTSTFVFHTAEEGKAFFELAYGKREKKPKEELGLIYSRLNNPDIEILEDRLCLWDESEAAAVFESGMAAISTVFFEFLSPGDVFLYSAPLYGGTEHFINHVLNKFNIQGIQFNHQHSKKDIIQLIEKQNLKDKLKLIYIETPSNPVNTLIDIEMCKEIADYFSTKQNKVIVVVDNTYLGPLWQHPLKHGSDLVLYSATKYIGGHSDLIAGACLGSKELIQRIKTLRSFLGNMAGPWTGWLLLRSLETLKVRMEQQAQNAIKIAEFLNKHPKVEKVLYLGLLDKKNPQYKIYQKQCLSPGAMLSFYVKGKEKQAFKFLNHLKLIHLAVSLGSTESLAEHPATMTHASVPAEEKLQYGITENMIRLSVGIENVDDLIADIDQALNKIS
ncbi:MAG: cystathionine gamma-synthase family protein [Bacteroidia bacterium]|nr:cystathionine gamma-synthase family protein [Bacteroidia bacterium]